MHFKRALDELRHPLSCSACNDRRKCHSQDFAQCNGKLQYVTEEGLAVEMMWLSTTIPLNGLKKEKKKSQTSNLKGSLFQNCSDRVSMKWRTILWIGPWAWEEKHHYKQWFTPLIFVCLLLCYVFLKGSEKYKWEGKAHVVEKGKKNLVEGGKKDILTPVCSA